MSIYAFVTEEQGTAMAGTGLCSRHLVSNYWTAYHSARDQREGFKPGITDVTGNEMIECLICGSNGQDLPLRELNNSF